MAFIGKLFGGGGSNETTIQNEVTSLTNFLAETTVNNMARSNTSVGVIQRISISGNTGVIKPITQTAYTNISSVGQQTTESAQQIADEVASDIQQKAKSDTDSTSNLLNRVVGIFSGNTEKQTISDKYFSKKTIERILNVTTLNEIIAGAVAEQSVEIKDNSGIIETISQSTVINIAVKAFQHNRTFLEMQSNLIEDLKQDASNKEKGLSSTLKTVAIVAGIGGVIYLVARSPNRGGGGSVGGTNIIIPGGGSGVGFGTPAG